VITLLDVNVLVAVTQPTHEHHRPASTWLRAQQASGWATTPLTELGLVRLSCHPRVTSPPLTPMEAIELLRALTAGPGHRFWPDELPVGEEALDWTTVRTHREVTDVRLVSIARSNAGRLATFDVKLARRHPESTELIAGT